VSFFFFASFFLLVFSDFFFVASPSSFESHTYRVKTYVCCYVQFVSFLVLLSPASCCLPLYPPPVSPSPLQEAGRVPPPPRFILFYCYTELPPSPPCWFHFFFHIRGEGSFVYSSPLVVFVSFLMASAAHHHLHPYSYFPVVFFSRTNVHWEECSCMPGSCCLSSLELL